MTGRIFRIELRQPAARLLMLVSLPALLFAVPEADRGLNVMVLDQRQLLPLAFSPLVIGIAAWYARRDHRSRMDELLATTPLPRWRRVLPGAAALATCTATGHLGVFAIMLVAVTEAGGHRSAVTVPIVLVGLLVLLVPVGLGLAAGRWLPFPLVPPLLVIYFIAIAVLGDTEGYGPGNPPPGTLLLLGGLDPGPVPFEIAAVTTRTHVAQAVWAVSLAVAGLVVFATARLRTRAFAIAPIMAGLLVALPLLPDRYADALYVDPGVYRLAGETE